ncbi:MAG: VWA domain-containing protein [Candidatus Sulfotelmatobacter sp.]
MTPCRTLSRAGLRHRTALHWLTSLPLRLAVVPIVLTAGASILGQEQSQPRGPASTPQTALSKAGASPSFMAETASPYVLVDVVATDARAHPVSGLTEDDFRIFEKIGWVTQVPEKIAAFRVVDKTGQGTTTEPPELLRSAPEVRGNLIAASEPAAPLTVLLLDNLNTDLYAPSVREQVASMADSICDEVPADSVCDAVPVAVLRLGNKLEMLQDFTTDTKVLRSTLRSAFVEKPSGSAEAPGSKGWLPAMQGSFGIVNDSSSLPTILNWNRQRGDGSDWERRVLMTMDAMRAIARHLAGYPGRKRLIWVSSSFPFSIAPNPGTNRFDDPVSYRSQAAVVMDALANARVSVYPARPGLVSKRQENVNIPRPSGQPGVTAMPAQAGADYFAATVPMEEFAGQTGGQACLDDRDLGDCFNRALRDGLFDYEMAYSPSAENWTEGFHRIVVGTAHRGVHLSFRQYYYVRGERAEGEDYELKQAACDDLMAATSLKIVAELHSAPPERTRYSLAVDGKLLTAASLGDHSQRLRLHLDFAACTFDAQGQPLQHTQYFVQQDMSADEFKSVQQNGFRRLMEFQPNERTAFLRWVVRDSLTGNLGSVDLWYQPPLPVAAAGSGNRDHPAPAVPSDSTAEPASIPQQPAPSAPSISAGAKLPPLNPDSGIEPYCAALSSMTEHSEALAEVCRFTLSLPRKMPNVICDLETKRHWRAYEIAHRDVVTATVTYADGQEHYSNIRIDGSVANAQALNSTWSMGEFASILQMVFSPSSDAEFRFSKEVKLNSAPSLVFEFRVHQLNNELYYLYAFYPNGSGITLFPAYRGRIWLNKSNFQLMRIEKETADMPPSFPITRATTVIDYADMQLGDGSYFVLPGKSEIETCSGSEGTECAHNVVRFKNWHKFRAKTHILSIEEPR